MAENSHDGWMDTDLWNELKSCDKPDKHLVVTILEAWMPAIEKVLKSGGTPQTDFTLHDAGHAFRVAQRMAEIMPSTTRAGLSVFDRAFLLLSAYLHDIGMTPEQRKVNLHYQYLVTGDKGDLGAEEVAEFQRFLDDDQDGLMPPLCEGPPSRDELARATRLVALYCRRKHNDWSGEWIRKCAPKDQQAEPSKQASYAPLGTFHDWVEYLVLLCASHHMGREELLADEFNPRQVGQPGQTLHLRYLACVLRVADVLEFDPERTPQVILEHREVDPESVIFWHKDKGVSRTLDNNRLILTARPATARIYRAVEETFDQIDQELSTARGLADETHFGVCPWLADAQPYDWNLSAIAHRDLQSKPGTFVYINSAFRPNTKKILELFSGLELYGDPLAAVRELLQNAFDAVRERMAYQRLAMPNPGDEGLGELLGKQHRVELRLESRPEGHWLVCSDTGVGMNKRIIENYLLVSGQAKRHDIAELERKCRDAGFVTGRTGKFGIGVLSYFMIADRLVLHTCRAQEAKDGDGVGWGFETEGVGGWGELREQKPSDAGARIELHLKKGIVVDPKQWYETLAEYLRRTLVFLPCDMQLNSVVPGCAPVAFDRGWTASRSDIEREFALHDDRYGMNDQMPLDLLPSDRRSKAEETERRWKEHREKAARALRVTTISGSLPGNAGRYRIHLAHFDLPGGASLAYFDAEERDGVLTLSRVQRGLYALPAVDYSASWKGMRVRWVPDEKLVRHRIGDLSRRHVITETDIHDESCGRVGLSRDVFFPTEDGRECMKWLIRKQEGVVRDFLVKHANSPYAVFNSRLCGIEPPAVSRPHWLLQPVDQSRPDAVWGCVNFPAVDSLVWRYEALPRAVTWRGKPVCVLPSVPDSQHDEHYEGTAWAATSYRQARVLLVPSWNRGRIVVLWERNPWAARAPHASDCPAAKFPPAWKGLLGVKFATYSYDSHIPLWNNRHRIAHMMSPHDWDSARRLIGSKEDVLKSKDTLLANTGLAAAWVACVLFEGPSDIWRGLIERDRAFLEELWRQLFPSRRREWRELALWVDQRDEPRLCVITPESWKTFWAKSKEDLVEIDKWLPDPGAEWTLQVDYGDDVLRRKYSKST